jgi:hypothetical protein
MNRRADRLDLELAARARSKRAFELCDIRPEYDPLMDVRDRQPFPIKCSMSKTSFEMAARQLGPSFVYTLYVHTLRLFQARNVVFAIVAQVKSNPFAPHVNIIECPELDEGEWVMEANDKRVGSRLL